MTRPPVRPGGPPTLPAEQPAPATIEAAIREAVVVRPGDILVVALSGAISPENAHDFRDRLEYELPCKVRVITSSDGVELAVIRKEDS